MLGPVTTTGIPTGAERTLELLERQVGRPLAEVETPVPVIDLDRLEANLTDLQSYVDEHGIELWPHTKTHKSPEIGRRQLELGAGGLTVAKTGEAQVFQEAGAPRILVHYPPFGADKWERLADVAASGVELTVAVDSVAPAEGLARTLDRRGLKAELLVEIDVGLHRTGQTTSADALAVAQALAKLPAVEVAGISCYPGHCRPEDPTLPQKLAGVDAFLRETRDAFEASGLRTDRISGGSTPTRHLTHTTCVNELRSGTYALLDRNDGEDDRVRPLGRGDGHLRCRSEPDRRRRRLEDLHLRRPSRRRPRLSHGLARAQTSRSSTRSTATSTSRSSTTGRPSAVTCRSSRTTRVAA